MLNANDAAALQLMAVYEILVEVVHSDRFRRSDLAAPTLTDMVKYLDRQQTLTVCKADGRPGLATLATRIEEVSALIVEGATATQLLASGKVVLPIAEGARDETRHLRYLPGDRMEWHPDARPIWASVWRQVAGLEFFPVAR